MTKSHTITLAALAGVTCLSAWQWMQLDALKEVNAALDARVKSAIPMAANEAPPPGGGRPRPGGKKDDFVAKAVSPEQQTKMDAERAARDAQFREARAMDRTQRLDARILNLKLKLNLTPEQEVAVRAAMENGSKEREALRDAGFKRRESGVEETEETRKAGRAKFAASDAAQEAALTSTMTADQLAAYDQYKVEQKQTQVESRANQQLNDLQNKLSLSTEQKDAAFQYYAKQAQDFDPGQIMAQGGDPTTAFAEQQKVTLEAMQQILTPEQYELYSKQEEERSAMFRQGFGGGRPGGPGGPGGGFGPPPGR